MMVRLTGGRNAIIANPFLVFTKMTVTMQARMSLMISKGLLTGLNQKRGWIQVSYTFGILIRVSYPRYPMVGPDT